MLDLEEDSLTRAQHSGAGALENRRVEAESKAVIQHDRPRSTVGVERRHCRLHARHRSTTVIDDRR